jgi:hypothetical protein
MGSEPTSLGMQSSGVTNGSEPRGRGGTGAARLSRKAEPRSHHNFEATWQHESMPQQRGGVRREPARVQSHMAAR